MHPSRYKMAAVLFLVTAFLAIACLAGSLFLSAAVAQDAPPRPPVPSKESQARARALILEIFKADLAGATEPAAQIKLAEYLLQQGKDSKDEPGNRFVLYTYARELAARAGEASLAMRAVEELARSFDIDALQMKAVTFAETVANTQSKEAGKAIVDMVLPLIADAVDADDYEIALKLAHVAEDAAKKAKSLALVSAIKKRHDDIKAVQEKFAVLKPYIDRLKADPKDAEANYELGRYFGMLKGKWDRALPLLALGSNAGLKAAAAKDVARPQEFKDQLALADAWWDLAAKEKDPAKMNMQVRARFWYEKSLLGLTGLNRTKAARRIELISARLEGTPAEVPIGPVGELKKLEGQIGEIKSVALSADGRHVAAGGKDQTVYVWNLGTGKIEATLKGHTNEVWGVAFVPNNRQVVSASWDGVARLWDIKSGTEIKSYKHPKDVNSVAVSRDGNQLLVGCDNRRFYLWDITSGREIKAFNGFTDFVYAVAFAPDGRHVAAGSKDNSIRIYDLVNGSQVRVIDGQNNAVHALAFSPDSRHLYSCGDSYAHQWDVATGKESRRFQGHIGPVLGLALSADGRRLVTGGDDKIVRLWDTATAKQLHAFKGHSDAINSVAISGNGRFAVSGGLDRTVRLWGLPAR
ncbi:MAG: WD40 repeat domain-containing protein [Planctomycetes bacterium]|nr:WD40 repeat domain-containing protein [Planctomycetota bacterium]